MHPTSPTDLYSPREIALAAGVSEAEVLAVLGPAREFVPYDEAVQVGRLLAGATNRRQSPIADRGAPIRAPQTRNRSAILNRSPIRNRSAIPDPHSAIAWPAAGRLQHAARRLDGGRL